MQKHLEKKIPPLTEKFVYRIDPEIEDGVFVSHAEAKSSTFKNTLQSYPRKITRAKIENAEYPLKQMIIVAIETGIRRGEILSIEWDDVDLSKGIIELKDTKNGERRFVPLSSRARFTIKQLPRKIKGRVFPTSLNSAVSHGFKRLCRNL